MAKVLNTENTLKEKYNKHSKKSKIYFILTIICFLLFIPTSGLTFLPFGLFGYLWVVNLNKAQTYGTGLHGEQKSIELFSMLPDTYYVLSDLLISIDGQTSQIDNIVVGDNGVFVIETKNINGLIEGNEKDINIMQHKIGRKGGRYSNQLYNPVKQVSTHVYRVSQLLKKHKIDKWIQGMVYFANENAQVFIESNSIPVFAAIDDGDKEIINYILNYKNKNCNLSQKEKEKIVKILFESDSNKNYNTKKIDMATGILSGNEDHDYFQQQMNMQQHKQHMDMHQQQMEMHQQSMEELFKASNPIDFGGYQGGPGFNPSETMHHNHINNL